MSLRMRVVLDLIVIRGAAAIFELCTGDAPAPHKRAAVIETVRSAFKCMPGTPGHGLTGLSRELLHAMNRPVGARGRWRYFFSFTLQLLKDTQKTRQPKKKNTKELLTD